jgi:hypothetical protein
MSQRRGYRETVFWLSSPGPTITTSSQTSNTRRQRRKFDPLRAQKFAAQKRAQAYEDSLPKHREKSWNADHKEEKKRFGNTDRKHNKQRDIDIKNDRKEKLNDRKFRDSENLDIAKEDKEEDDEK